MAGTCEYQTEIGHVVRTCSRQLFRDKFCVLHYPSPRKEVNTFLDALRAELNSDEENTHDLTGVHFIECSELFKNRTVEKALILDKSLFYGQAVFDTTTFNGPIIATEPILKLGLEFINCTFRDKIDLSIPKIETGGLTFHSKCTFNGELLLNDPKLGQFQREIQLNDCTFESIARINEVSCQTLLLLNCRFETGLFVNGLYGELRVGDDSFFRGESYILQLSPSTMVFVKVHFLGKTKLLNDTIGNQIIKFDDCNMSEVSISGLPISEREAAFKKCTWSRKVVLGAKKTRYWLADERDVEARKSQNLLKAYRYLHKYYYDLSQFRYARDFYIGMMNAKRLAIETSFLAKIIDWVYYRFSNYGESIIRPAILLLLMWFLAPIFLLFFGINLFPAISDNMTQFHWDIGGQFIPLTKEYWQTFSFNLLSTTLFRSPSHLPPLATWQAFMLFIETLLNILFVGFMALGIRRHFVPKKPLD